MDVEKIKKEVILNLKEDSSREENIERLNSLIIARICDTELETLHAVRADLKGVVASLSDSLDYIEEVKKKYCRVQESKF